MNRRLREWLVLTLCLVGGLATVQPAEAATIAVQPLQYRESIGVNETKTGYLDISNPSGQALVLDFVVQGFRQINDDGGLEFYASRELQDAISLDLDTAELPPREALRLYFTIDGSKLPSGDVFAVIMASAQSVGAVGVPEAQVGSLLLLQHGGDIDHTAIVESAEVPLIQVGDAIQFVATLKNTTDTGSATGFFPTVNISTSPYGSEEVKGPLIFNGRSRVISYRQAGNYIGPVIVRIGVGDSETKSLSFVITGYWRWLAPMIVVVILCVGLGWRLLYRRLRALK